MKKGLVLVIILIFLISMQFVFAASKNLGRGIIKTTNQDGSITWTHNNKVIKTQDKNGVVMLFDPTEPKMFKTKYILKDFQVFGNTVVIKENYNTNELLFHQVVGGKEMPIPFFSSAGNFSFDSANKKFEIKIPVVEGGVLKTYIQQPSIVISPKGNIKLINKDNKVLIEILKNGDVLIFDKQGKILTIYNPSKLITVFPPIKDMMTIGVGDTKTDNISAFSYRGIQMSAFEFLRVTHKNVDEFYFLLGGHVEVKNKHEIFLKKLQPISNYKVVDHVFFARDKRDVPFFFQLKGDNLTVEITQSRNLITKQKGVHSLIVVNESLKKTKKVKEDGGTYDEEEWIPLRNHELKCADEKCEMEMLYNLKPRDLTVIRKIIGAAAFLTPKGKEKEKHRKLFVEARAKDKKEEKNTKEVFDNTRFYDVNISNVSLVYFAKNAKTGFLILWVTPMAGSSFADVKIASKNRQRLPLQMNIFLRKYSMHNKGYFLPFLVNRNFIIEENKNDLIIVGTEPNGNVLYKENGRKLFNFKNGYFVVLKEPLRNALFDFFGVGSNIIFLGKDSITTSMESDGLGGRVTNLEIDPSVHKAKYKYYDIQKFVSKEGKTVQKSIITFKKNNNNTMLFKYDKAVASKGSRWYDHGVSFKTFIYQEVGSGKRKQKIFIPFECRIGASVSQHKCYFNNKPITYEAQPKLKNCKTDAQCPQGQKCVMVTHGYSSRTRLKRGYCASQNLCKKLNIADFNGPIKIVFVNDGIVEQNQFKDLVQEIIGFSETGTSRKIYNIPTNQQMFRKEPFLTNRNHFSILYIDEKTQFIETLKGFRGPDLKIAGQVIKKNCPNADYIIMLSGSLYGSHANLFSGLAAVSARDLRVSGNIVPHEFGHSGFFLGDEYFNEKKMSSGLRNAWMKRFMKKASILWNCANDQKNANLKKWDAATYNAAVTNKWQGCGGTCPPGCSNWYETGKDSIMSRAIYFDDFTPFVRKGIEDRLKGRNPSILVIAPPPVVKRPTVNKTTTTPPTKTTPVSPPVKNASICQANEAGHFACQDNYGKSYFFCGSNGNCKTRPACINDNDCKQEGANLVCINGWCTYKVTYPYPEFHMADPGAKGSAIKTCQVTEQGHKDCEKIENYVYCYPNTKKCVRVYCRQDSDCTSIFGSDFYCNLIISKCAYQKTKPK